MSDRICTNCGYTGQPSPQGIGSFTVDVIVWLVCWGLAVFSDIFALMLIAVAWSLYHVALYKIATCPSCGDMVMVALDSEKAERYHARQRSPIMYVAQKH